MIGREEASRSVKIRLHRTERASQKKSPIERAETVAADVDRCARLPSAALCSRNRLAPVALLLLFPHGARVAAPLPLLIELSFGDML